MGNHRARRLNYFAVLWRICRSRNLVPPSPEALLLCLFVAAYVGPIYFLDRIERYTTLTRKRIWVVSLVIHAPIALFAVIAAIVWSWGFLLLLVPELIGTVLLVRGVGFHVNGHTMSNIKMTP